MDLNKEIENMTTTCGNYVLAGGDTFASLLHRFMISNPGYITPDNLRDFFKNSIGRFLYSYGTGLNYKSKKLAENYNEKILNSLNKFMNFDFMDSATLYLDSGGFQIANGALGREDIIRFIEMYYTFIEQNSELIDYAFLLDIPPGPGLTSFQVSSEELYELNKLSYSRALQVPDKIRQEKLIYIHHFRTPRIYNTWMRLLKDDDLAKDYNYYATGGLVAFGSSDITIPAILYSIPLSTIITHCKEKKINSFKFHVLGGANLIDIFYHQLFSKHIKEFHGIDCQITYDSSSVFKGAFNGRYINTIKEDGSLVKMSFKSNEMHIRYDNDFTIEEKMYDVLNRVASLHNLKLLDPAEVPIYDSETGTLSRQVTNYIMLEVLQLYKDVEEESKILSEQLYKIYQKGDVEKFNKQALQITKMFNQGKSTKKQRSKTFSIYNSLKILENLDEEYGEYIINKYMSGGDSDKLEVGGCIQF